MEDIRLIASDMDHTLLTETSELPPDFHSYVDRLNQAGIVFVAASGRPLFTLQTMFPAGGPGLGYIGDNGGTVSYDGEVLFESLLSTADYQAMIALTHQQTAGVPIICGIETAYVASAHRMHEEFLRTFYSEITFVDDLTVIDADADKFTVYFPGGGAIEICDDLYRPAYDRDFSVTIGGVVWVDIMNPGVTKGSGLRVLADRLGLDPAQMMAFGDTYNDIEMLDEVYYSYAVSNAEQAVRDRARFVTGSNDEYGVVSVIREVLSQRGGC
ncbi:MAG: HAD family phosphatase [Propionibacterium sp.]|jgi:Cof subfamily protein (haloacid dehalogenase superfamily)|nr:HAD family phosphatase [Propionibacterium sp.]